MCCVPVAQAAKRGVTACAMVRTANADALAAPWLQLHLQRKLHAYTSFRGRVGSSIVTLLQGGGNAQKTAMSRMKNQEKAAKAAKGGCESKAASMNAALTNLSYRCLYSEYLRSWAKMPDAS